MNRRLTAMPKECAPFAAVEGCLAAVRAVADVVAMGTGTPAAVRGEWTRGGLSGYTDAVFAAPQDGKAEALIPVFGAGYLPSHMLVVGDTLGDAALAAQAGALFFPILPGREEACWQRLAEEGFPKFLHGSFAGAYEDTLRKAQRSLFALGEAAGGKTAHSINGKEERPMDGKRRADIRPGQQVEIVLKKTSPPAGAPAVWCGAS